jgi:hypothetical protein
LTIQQGADLPKEVIERVEFELLLHHCLSGQLFHMPDSEHAVRHHPPPELLALDLTLDLALCDARAHDMQDVAAAVEEVRRKRKNEGGHLSRNSSAALRRLLLVSPEVRACERACAASASR